MKKNSMLARILSVAALAVMSLVGCVSEGAQDGEAGVSSLGSLPGLVPTDLGGSPGGGDPTPDVDPTPRLSPVEACERFHDIFGDRAEECGGADAEAVKTFLRSSFPGGSCASVFQLRDEAELTLGCFPRFENASCEEFNAGISEPACAGQFIFDQDFTNAFGACQDVARAFAALVGLCGGDFDESFAQALEGLNCGAVVDIRDRGDLYGGCIPAILGGSCEDTDAGFSDPACATQLLLPAEG